MSNKLETEIVELRARISDLERRVRLSGIAERFVAGNFEIRSGDFVRFGDDHATYVNISDSSGKWTYTDRHGHRVEPFRIPPEPDIERLYTIAEVAEIVTEAINLAKASQP